VSRNSPEVSQNGARKEMACNSVPKMAHLTGRMIDRTKKLPVRFYLSPTGRNPVREWILELPSEDRHTVGKDIQKLEFGWPIGRPHCAPLGHGFIKKTQKTPQQDVDLALKRKREVT
jgi:hypothetical protein